jgi:hypothetical protein
MDGLRFTPNAAKLCAAMIPAKVIFGKCGWHKPAELEDLVEFYFAALYKQGQVCGEYFLPGPRAN